MTRNTLVLITAGTIAKALLGVPVVILASGAAAAVIVLGAAVLIAALKGRLNISINLGSCKGPP